MQEFLQMGGYAAYVWSAFGITTIVLIANLVLARQRDRSVIERNRRRIGSHS